MGNKKKLVQLLAGFAFLIGFSNSALATPSSPDETVKGGWSEDGGYFSTTERKISPSAEVIVDHNGWAEKNSWGAERAVGTTWWKDTYHYTRARMELPGGNAVTDSGRQYGYVNTYAASPYADPNFLAKTYYGKD
ncbi:hypothetical protein ACU1JV_23210 [Paenibacillus sp. T2-29]|uniref:hypothetical protein n=1 Tax=Paenibacillus TaxID=44249 RepID=UPI0039BC677B